MGIDAKQAYRDNHKAQGLCRQCPNPVRPYMTMCPSCLAKLQARAILKNYRAMQTRRNIAEGRCTTCGAPLDPEVDAGYKSCITCREHRRWKF